MPSVAIPIRPVWPSPFLRHGLAPALRLRCHHTMCARVSGAVCAVGVGGVRRVHRHPLRVLAARHGHGHLLLGF